MFSSVVSVRRGMRMECPGGVRRELVFPAHFSRGRTPENRLSPRGPVERRAQYYNVRYFGKSPVSIKREHERCAPRAVGCCLVPSLLAKMRAKNRAVNVGNVVVLYVQEGEGGKRAIGKEERKRPEKNVRSRRIVHSSLP